MDSSCSCPGNLSHFGRWTELRQQVLRVQDWRDTWERTQFYFLRHFLYQTPLLQIDVYRNCAYLLLSAALYEWLPAHQGLQNRVCTIGFPAFPKFSKVDHLAPHWPTVTRRKPTAAITTPVLFYHKARTRWQWKLPCPACADRTRQIVSEGPPATAGKNSVWTMKSDSSVRTIVHIRESGGLQTRYLSTIQNPCIDVAINNTGNSECVKRKHWNDTVNTTHFS